MYFTSGSDRAFEQLMQGQPSFDHYDAVTFRVKGVENMAVFRVERNKGCTVMHNHHLQNKDLSLKAKGLLSQMLPLPEDWDYTRKGKGLALHENRQNLRWNGASGRYRREIRPLPHGEKELTE